MHDIFPIEVLYLDEVLHEAVIGIGALRLCLVNVPNSAPEAFWTSFDGSVDVFFVVVAEC